MRSPKPHPIPKTLRRFPRHQQLSELSLTYEGGNETLRIQPPNLSAKGMFISTGVAFPEGSVLKLNFRLARTGARIVTRCEVRYCLPAGGLGVEFIDLPAESARAIEAEIGMSEQRSKTAPKRQKYRK